MKSRGFFLLAAGVVCLGGHAQAQHLWWNLKGQTNATCLYGEVTVLATHPAIYYCGANWHPGEPAGGYCGIQDNSATERRTIFSVWDTSPELHPQTTAADPQTVAKRFGGEGEGGHTHMLWDWKEGETFQFFVQKIKGDKPDTTAARYFIFDRTRQIWRHSATITSPNGSKPSVATIGGGLNSFLENFRNKDRAEPKLALYRLWLGSRPEQLQRLTRARGDGIWGQLHDCYFLAEGDPTKLDAVFARVASQYGQPVFGGKTKKLEPLTDKPLPADLVAALQKLEK